MATPLRITRLAGFGKKPPQVFASSPVTLGTAPSSSVRFDPSWDKGVAPQHARLEWNGGGWVLVDLGSPSGIYLDGRRLTAPVIISGPVEFELGQGGPRCLAEPSADSPASAASSYQPAAPGRVHPAAPVPVVYQTAMPPLSRPSGVPVWIVVLCVVVVLAVGGGVAAFLLLGKSTPPAAVAQNNAPTPLPPRTDTDQQPTSPTSAPKLALLSVNLTHATGLLTPNAKQRALIDQTFPTVRAVKFNSFAMSRLPGNSTYAASTPAARAGEEMVTSPDDAGDANTFSATSSSTIAAAPTELPSAVDNSTLPCFPGVGNQGSIGSCASFSSVYYSASHNIALVRANGNPGQAKPVPLSPFWTYPQVNKGEDSGSLFESVLLLLENHGAPTLASYPYPSYEVADPEANPAPPEDFRPWPTDPALWREALHNRVGQIGKIEHLDTAEGQRKLKAFLANGYLANYGTYIGSWKMVLSQSDPSLGDVGNSHANQPVCALMLGTSGGHAMTIVGYDDNIWIDFNGDHQVQPEEKGAFKIVNSWGTKWPREEDGGFAWISYDALRQQSAFPELNVDQRKPVFMFNEAWYMLPHPDAPSHFLAQFTISNAHRNEIDVRLGVSTTALKEPAKIWRPAALTITDLDKEADDKPQDWTSGMGGPWAFDGTNKESPGTFAFGLDDLLKSFTDPLPGNQYRFYLMVTDLKKGNPTTISDYKITDGDGKVLAQANGLPIQVDDNSQTLWLDCPTSPSPAPSNP